MSTKYIATGIEVSFKVSDAEKLSAELLDVDDAGEETAQVDVTHQGSTDLYREFLPGLVDGGEVTLKLLYDPDATAQPESRQTGVLEIKWPAGASKRYRANANVKHIGKIEAKLGEKIVQDVTFKITGKPDRAADATPPTTTTTTG